jgi:AcrR family transcriptional regulator
MGKGTGGDGAGRKLPRGPHKLAREVVIDHQRRRLLTAAAEVLTEHGYPELTVESILDRAQVSRTTFYKLFKNKRECVLAAHEAAFDRLSSTIMRACAEERDWPARVAAGIGAAIDYARESPREAQLLILDAVAADRHLARSVIASTDFLVGLMRAGREHSPAAAELPALTEHALIGAVTSVIGVRLVSGQAERLPELKSQLVELLLLPYVGPEEARRLATSQA